MKLRSQAEDKMTNNKEDDKENSKQDDLEQLRKEMQQLKAELQLEKEANEALKLQADSSIAERDRLNNICRTLEVQNINASIASGARVESTTQSNISNAQMIDALSWHSTVPQMYTTSTATNVQTLITPSRSMITPAQQQGMPVLTSYSMPTVTFNTPVTTYANPSCNVAMPQNSVMYTPSTNLLQSPNQVQDNQHAHVVVPQVIRKLHDLPIFDGRPEDWPVFHNAYTETTLAFQYTALENTLRLQKCIKGAAHEEIKSMLINPQNVTAAIQQLQFRFGQPEQLIRSQLAQIKEIQPITESRMDKMIALASKVRNLTAFLKSAGATSHLTNPMLIEDLVNKMPLSKIMEWASYSMEVQPYPSLEQFDQCITAVAGVVTRATTYSSEKEHVHQCAESNTRRAVHNEAKVKTCVECEGQHNVTECKAFKEKSVNQRWELVKKKRLCFACLSKGHGMYQCRKKKVCRIDECKRVHHALLHNKVSQQDTSQTERMHTINASNKILYKILPVQLKGEHGEIVNTYAMLDEGSSCTLMEESMAVKLGKSRPHESLSLQWVGGREVELQTMSTNVSIKGSRSSRWRKLKARTVPNLGLPTQTVNISELHTTFQKLKHIPVMGYEKVEPTILIGIDNCHLVASMKTIRLASPSSRQRHH